MWHRTLLNLLAGSVLCAGFGGCVLDGEDGLTADDRRPTPTFFIGGTIVGSTGPIALQNSNGTNVIVFRDGAFTFETPMVSSALYNVTIAVPPNAQSCRVWHGAGTVQSADISNIAVVCAPNPYRSSGVIAASDLPRGGS